MKKTIILLAVALIAVPAWAAVTVTGADTGGNSGIGNITYSVTGTPKVRAFALNITVDNGAVISAVTVGNSKYTIYPGTIVINGNNVDANGTPVAVKAQLPGDTLDGLGTSGVTLEMASLYVGEANAPASSGTLVSITVDKSCHVTIAGNASRGNVVMEDLSAVSPTYTGFDIVINAGGCTSCAFDQDGDGWVTLDDLIAMLEPLVATDPDFYFEAGDGTWCFDGDGDGWVTLDDLIAVLEPLVATDPDFYYPCPE